jgi:hypothetical protein
MRIVHALPALLAALSMQTALADADLLARGGETEFRFNTGILEAYGVEIQAAGVLSDQPPTNAQGYRHIRFAGTDQHSLAMEAPNLALRSFPTGGLGFSGRLEFTRNARSVALNDFALSTAATSPPSFHLMDEHGKIWLILDHVHFELMDDADWLSLRYMDLRVTPAFAEALDVPEMNGERIGGVFVSSPVIERAEGLEPLGSCQAEFANWPTEEGFDADIAMTDMGTPSVARCMECDGATGGPMVVIPSATLTNVGSADVPWYVQFSDPAPPYDNDQHPYLIWNLYRLSADGQFEMIAVSGLKHTFFTINIGVDCPCPGGNILWSGCVDIYAANSNDIGTYLAPRNEVVPANGLWGRCHSFFDAECDGQQSQGSGNVYENRMLVMESELDPVAHPDARYFVDSWYVARDEINIFNAMGWLEVTPVWNGSNWQLPIVAGTEMNQGSVLDAWVTGRREGESRTVVSTEQGTVVVAVRTTSLGDSRWRYDYAVFNYDFMIATVEGSVPDLQVTYNQGVIGFQVPAQSTVVVEELDFARADRLTGQDWTVDRQLDHVHWADPGDTPLNWGMMYRFSLVADSSPVHSELKLIVGEEEGEFIGLTSLAPSPAIFRDRFQAAQP